jgi:hypothetical protein
MKNCRRMFLVITICLTLMFLGCAGTQKVGNNGSLVMVKSSIANVSQSDIERVKKEGEKSLNLVCPILGIEKNKRIKIQIVKGGICNAYGGIVSLPLWRVQNKTAVVVHEVTHIVAKHSDNRFFSEGLAVYFQQRFGEDQGFPDFGRPLHILANSYIESQQFMPLSNLKYNNDIFRAVGTHKRKIAYVEAGSFFGFLLEKYGEQKLSKLHNSWSLNYKKVYGKSMKELEAEWKGFISK